MILFHADFVQRCISRDKEMSEVIRVEENGVEYFTVEATGESGLSISGIGRFCGVYQSTITRLTKDLMHKAPSKWLKGFVGKNLYLMQSYIKKGGKVKIVKAKVVSAIVRHYAIENKLETAILALSKFSDAGITLFIQQMTGWQPAGSSTTPKQLKAAIECRQIYENLEHFNPRVAQLLVDNYVNEIISNALPPNPERLLGVMEISAELGYRIPNNYRSSLGRYVSHRCQDFAKEEQRLVNGQLRFCKLYPLNNSFVRGAITEYARAKELID